MTMAMEVDDSPRHEEPVESVLQLMSSPMNRGEYWYLVDKRWFETFKSYIKDKNPSHNPGPIDNSALFKNSTSKDVILELRARLQEEIDYVFVPEKAWELLVNTFSIVNDNHSIKRPVIEQGSISHYTVVEVYPIELKLCTYGSKSEIVQKTFSRVTTLGELIVEMKRIFNVDPRRETQVWWNGSVLNPPKTDHPPSTSTSTFIPPPPPPPLPGSTTRSESKANENHTLDDLGIHSTSVVTLEVINEDGTWPSSRPRAGLTTRSSKCTPGLCGLMNLGNTCFMNSALQCMSNTPLLTDFFLTDAYLHEINYSNPLGMGGQIAKTYGELIKSIWSGYHSCLAPRDFKLAVGRFAPQFSGFQQQDCQELMAFLLDGLHEDLNRITTKPYIPINNEIERRPDHIVAAESWSNYTRRNDSIIVDTFHGLLKSTLVCPDCALVSVTFDPFCYLSLPLPVKRERPVDVYFFPATTPVGMDGAEKPVQVVKLTRVMIPKVGTISEICQIVARHVNENKDINGGYTVNAEKLIVADVYNHRFHKLFSNDDSYAANLEPSICVYETVEDKVPLPVYLREDKGSESYSLFGHPVIVNVEEPVTYEVLYDAVYGQVKKFFRNGNAEDIESDTDEGVAGCDDADSQMFTISLVNSHGTLTHEKLERRGVVKVNNKIYVAADFKTRTKGRYLGDDTWDDVLCTKISVSKNSTSSKVSVQLSDCISQFTTTEKLGSDDPWYCPRCKKHQEATKKFDLWSLPRVLIIHLKRFSYSRFWRDKLDILVEFPTHGFNMKPYVINENDSSGKYYDLCAVANHYGGLGGGHYTAYGKNRETGSWHYFDDSNVTPASEENVVSKAAYVLFYVRRD